MATIDDFRKIKKIGEGSYGEVFQVSRKSDSKLFALKIITDDAPNLIEIDILRRIKHRNIAYAQKIFMKRVRSSLEISIIMDLAETDLDDWISTGLPQDKYESLIWDITQGIAELHRNGIFHADLKPGNILISDGIAKLADFGLSKYSIDKKFDVFCDGVVTFPYRGPEVLACASKRLNWFAADIWSLGAIIYKMLTNGVYVLKFKQGKTNFEGLAELIKRFGPARPDQIKIAFEDTNTKIPTQVADYDGTFNYTIFKTNPKYKDLLLYIFEMDWAKRPTADDVLRYMNQKVITVPVKFQKAKVVYQDVVVKTGGKYTEKNRSDLLEMLFKINQAVNHNEDIFFLAVDICDRFFSLKNDADLILYGIMCYDIAANLLYVDINYKYNIFDILGDWGYNPDLARIDTMVDILTTLDFQLFQFPLNKRYKKFPNTKKLAECYIESLEMNQILQCATPP